jgi:excisionase family DNA binding protein
MDSLRPYLTIRETATLLALSKRTIDRYIAEGKLKVYRVAGEKAIRIKLEDVEARLIPVSGGALEGGADIGQGMMANNVGRRIRVRLRGSSSV